MASPCGCRSNPTAHAAAVKLMPSRALAIASMRIAARSTGPFVVSAGIPIDAWNGPASSIRQHSTNRAKPPSGNPPCQFFVETATGLQSELEY